MYDPTKPGYHTHNQTWIPPNYEPTIPDNPYSYSPYDLQNILTPPKPPHVQNKVAFALAAALVVLLVVISGLVLGLVNMSNKLAVNVPTPVGTGVKVTSILSSPTQVPTNQTQNSSGYTAQDLLHDFINAGASVYLPQNNETLWDWSGQAFSVKELSSYPWFCRCCKTMLPFRPCKTMLPFDPLERPSSTEELRASGIRTRSRPAVSLRESAH